MDDDYVTNWFQSNFKKQNLDVPLETFTSHTLEVHYLRKRVVNEIQKINLFTTVPR